MVFSLASAAKKKPFLTIKQILIIKHGALGDLIQSIGVIMDICQHHQNDHITLLTSPAYVSLMQRCTYIDHIIIDHRAAVWRPDLLFKLKQQLQKPGFDCVYDLQNSTRTRWYRQCWFPHTQWVGRNKGEVAPASGLAGLLYLLKRASIPIKYSRLADLVWMLDDITKILKDNRIHPPFIALIPGSSAQHPEKRWPHFTELAHLLMLEGYQIVMILGPAETALAKHAPCTTLSGLSWFELAGVLNAAQFVIGNDSGPSHLASHLNKPGLALFGSSTSATRSELGHRRFTTLQVAELATLSATTVRDYVFKQLNETS